MTTKEKWNELRNWLIQQLDFHLNQRILARSELDLALENENINMIHDVLFKMLDLDETKYKKED